MWPSGSKPRVSSLKILAMISENCQSHHVLLWEGILTTIEIEKKIDGSHLELSTFAAKILFSVLKMVTPRCIEECNPFYI